MHRQQAHFTLCRVVKTMSEDTPQSPSEEFLFRRYSLGDLSRPAQSTSVFQQHTMQWILPSGHHMTDGAHCTSMSSICDILWSQQAGNDVQDDKMFQQWEICTRMTISRITIEFVFCIVVDKWDIMQVFDFHTFCAVKHTGLSIKLEKNKSTLFS